MQCVRTQMQPLGVANSQQLTPNRSNLKNHLCYYKYGLLQVFQLKSFLCLSVLFTSGSRSAEDSKFFTKWLCCILWFQRGSCGLIWAGKLEKEWEREHRSCASRILWCFTARRPRVPYLQGHHMGGWEKASTIARIINMTVIQAWKHNISAWKAFVFNRVFMQRHQLRFC